MRLTSLRFIFLFIILGLFLSFGANLSSACLVPSVDDNFINESTTLCRDEYFFVDNNSNVGVFIINHSDVVFDCNNSFIDGSGQGLFIRVYSGLDNVTLTNCSATNFVGGVCLSSTNSLISNSYFSNLNYSGSGSGPCGPPYNKGIYLVDSADNLTVFNVTIDTVIVGIDFGGFKGININHVDIHNADQTGFSAFSSEGAIISNSGVYDSEEGFTDAMSINLTLDNFTLDSISGYGVNFYGSRNSTLKNSNISYVAQTAILLRERTGVSASGNLIFNNYFSNNAININTSDQLNNSFNTTKFSGTNIIGGPNIGGNFYDTYLGQDSDADGIGETFYSIVSDLGSIYDYLPLTNNQTVVEKSVSIVIENGLNFYEGETITFNISFENFSSPKNLSMDFGDGEIHLFEDVHSPVFIDYGYSDNANFSVNATVIDSVSSESNSTLANVINSIPFNINEVHDSNQGFDFSFKPSFQDNGTNDTHEINVSWGDGILSIINVSGFNYVYHNYSSDGNYTINFTIVDDDQGVSSELSFNISLIDEWFVLLQNQTINASSNASVELSYYYIDSNSVNVSWGDGSFTYDSSESNGSSYEHNFSSLGTFNVSAVLTGCKTGSVCPSPNDYFSSVSVTVQGCGDGIVQSWEECDGSNFNGETCSDYGYNSGSLSCSSSCIINSSSCYTSSGGSSGGSGSSSSSDDAADDENNTIQNGTCVENWTCEEWFGCVFDNVWERNCLDSNNCGTSNFKPNLTKECDIDFEEALTMTRDQIASLIAGDLSDESLRKLQESDSLLVQAQIDFEYGYLGNALLMLRESFHILRSMPELEMMNDHMYRLSRLSLDLVRDLNLNSNLFDVQKEKINSRLDILENEIRSQYSEEYIFSLIMIYRDFLILDDVFVVSTDVDALELSNQLDDEFSTYISHDSISALDSIKSVRLNFRNNIIWKLEELVDLGILSDFNMINLLSDLREIKSDLHEIQDEDFVWTNTWEFGIDNIINHLFLNETHCGNGILENYLGELCDDGNNNDFDGCTSKCNIRPVTYCDNGMIEGLEGCDYVENNNTFLESNSTVFENLSVFNETVLYVLKPQVQELFDKINSEYNRWSDYTLSTKLTSLFERMNPELVLTSCYQEGALDSELENLVGCSFYYLDNDSDGFIDSSDSKCLCSATGSYSIKDSSKIDCDDQNSAVYPGAVEVCDGFDNDCDSVVDGENLVGSVKYYFDGDGDGFGISSDYKYLCSPSGAYTVTNISTGFDCNDTSASINPDAQEVLDGYDNNCNGAIDRDDENCSMLVYEDNDDDGFGSDVLVRIGSCIFEESSIFVKDGYSTISGDCNDNNPFVFPNALEICDGVDNNCNGKIDIADDTLVDPSYVPELNVSYNNLTLLEGLRHYDFSNNDPEYLNTVGIEDYFANARPVWIFYDNDRDRFGDINNASESCTVSSIFLTSEHKSLLPTDCNDNDESIHPGVSESCDGVDEDCDGEVDYFITRYFYDDYDGDGFGNHMARYSKRIKCDQELTYARDNDYATNDDDCDDFDASINPNATEICDDIDRDCFGGPTVSLRGVDIFYDCDGDGYGFDTFWSHVSLSYKYSCSENPVSHVYGDICLIPDNYVLNSNDCNDQYASINPGVEELFDSTATDENCDGLVYKVDFSECPGDHSLALSWLYDGDGDGYGSRWRPGDPENKNPEWNSYYPYGDYPDGRHRIDKLSCSDESDHYTRVWGDCDDSDASVYPGAEDHWYWIGIHDCNKKN